MTNEEIQVHCKSLEEATDDEMEQAISTAPIVSDRLGCIAFCWYRLIGWIADAEVMTMIDDDPRTSVGYARIVLLLLFYM